MNQRLAFILIFSLYIFSTIAISKDKAIEWFEKGVQSKNLPEKILCFKKALEINPNFLEAFFNLGCAYRDSGDMENAEKSFNRALLVSPDNISTDVKLKIIFELGKANSRLGKYQYAIESFMYARKIAKGDEVKSSLFLELGKCYLYLNEFDQAINCFNEGLKLQTADSVIFKSAIANAQRLKEVQNNYTHGMNFFTQENYEQAIVYFNKVLEIDSNYKDCAEKLAQARDSLNQPEIKQPVINDSQIVEIPANREPDVTKNDYSNLDIEQLYQLGLTALKTDNWHDAIRYFYAVKAIQSNYKDINSRLMEARLGKESAMEMDEVARVYNQAMAKYESGDWLQAILNFEKAKMMYPGYKDIELKIAEAKKRLNVNNSDMNKNPVITSEMEESAPNKYWIFLALILPSLLIPISFIFIISPEARAKYYLLRGKNSRAIQVYEHELAKHPKKTKVYINLANLYLIDNRSDKLALKVYQFVLKGKTDSNTKEKIIEIVANEYLKRKIINPNSIKLLTHLLENEIKRLE